METASIQPLIDPREFAGIETVTHLCAGGEAPILRAGLTAIERFAADKSCGMPGRERMFRTYDETKQHLSWLLNRPPGDIALLGSASEGINLVARAIDWKPGDNIVVADAEFPSLIYPWTQGISRGAELRALPTRSGLIELSDLRAAVDKRTRVVAISQVSYLTGQRISLPAVADIAWQVGARLVVDATHALGVVPVDANYCDFLVSSCYKWLLAGHGLGVFVWNRSRVPELKPASLGWHSIIPSSGPATPLLVNLRPDADRLEAGNPAFPSIYLLHASLTRLAEIPERVLLKHVIDLGTVVLDGLRAHGLDVVTPFPAEQRAGNLCFRVPDAEAIAEQFGAHGVVLWGSDGRVRVSVHAYNGSRDVDRLLELLDVCLDRHGRAP